MGFLLMNSTKNLILSGIRKLRTRTEEIKRALIDSLQQCGRVKEAFNVHDCGLKWMHMGCKSCESSMVLPWFCNHRLCPTCQRRRSRRVKESLKANFELLKKFETGRDYHSVKVRMVTLTVKNPDYINREYYRWLKSCLTKLRRSKMFKNKVLAGYYVIETTRNEESKTWHPHIHMLIAARYIRQADLMKAWKKITKHSFVVGITLADRNSINEIGKYVTKSTNFINDPQGVNEFLSSVKGLRLNHSFGEIYNHKKLKECNSMICSCPTCGAHGWYLIELIDESKKCLLLDASTVFLPEWAKGTVF